MLKRWTPLVVLAFAGCASLGPSAGPMRDASAAAVTTPDRAGAAAPAAKTAMTAPAGEVSEQQAMAEVGPMLAELAKADPKLHAEVLEQLAGSKPSLWSLTVQRAQQTHAYKQQLAQSKPAAALALPASTPINTIAANTTTLPPTAAATALLASNPPTQPNSHSQTSGVVQASATMEPQAHAPLPAVVGASGATPSVIQNQHFAGATPAMAPAAEPVARPHFPPTAPAQASQPMASPTSLSAPADWRTHLDAAIARLGEDNPSPPGSTDKARERVRLQLLQLAAGDTQRATAAPTGLSAAEQGYWSNQLYALSTLLEKERSTDLRARADAAARHQSEASAKLRAMGSLQVRNFVACREVYGFGAYEPLADQNYAPGDQVVLYAEVDHYQSDATKEGYRTTIASSYRLLDEEGAEVASGDFPEVDDLCLTLRRDFHIQYGVTLPVTLTSGDYRLELTVHDRLADKLGHDELSIAVGPR